MSFSRESSNEPISNEQRGLFIICYEMQSMSKQVQTRANKEGKMYMYTRCLTTMTTNFVRLFSRSNQWFDLLNNLTKPNK